MSALASMKQVHWRQDKTLPEGVRKALGSFCDRMEEQFAKTLSSIVLYGGLAQGDYDPDLSDVNVLIVFAKLEPAQLDRLAPPIEVGMRRVRLAPWVATVEELHGNADVFAVELLDIQHHHRMLVGEDPVSGLRIEPRELRLGAERALRELQAKLRLFYFRHRARPDLQARYLASAVVSFLVQGRAMIYLDGGQLPSGRAATVARLREAVGLEVDGLGPLLELRSGRRRPTASRLREMYLDFLGIVGRSVEWVDRKVIG